MAKGVEKNTIDKLERIEYEYFHWGPYLYRTLLSNKKVEEIKKLCSKQSTDYRDILAGLLKHEHQVDVKKLFRIIGPYFNSYAQGYVEYTGKVLGNKIELIKSWVNFMTKFESNPLHRHDEDLSFVIFLEVPKNLEKEYNETISNCKPGTLNFVYSLGDRKEFINQRTFYPVVGEMFIFPSSLHHYINSFQCKGERISVSGNLKVTNG